MSYLGENIGKLGFGLMRLPKLDDDHIDVEQVKQMVDLFMDAGFTYFDTAWAYGGSEDAIRQALVERYPRDSFQLATKAASWINCKTAEDAHAQFEKSLELTGAGYFDYYLLHNLGEFRTKYFDDYDMWNWLQEKKAAGLIKHLGFSFHSTADELEAILTEHPEMEFVQLQINYADWESPSIQSRQCYEVAKKHGKPVIIMEPVKGGLLSTPPESVEAILKAAEPDSSCASWALRFAADLDGIITVLSGMSNIDQMADNLAVMKDFKGLTDAQREVLSKARTELENLPIVPCTSCDYCAKVCPNNIGISGSFTALNIVTLYDNVKFARDKMHWSVEVPGKKMASECVKCGACEEACPQHIGIIEALEKVSETFGV
ncbi:MAG: aldo/keto reductase [Bacillota bacterium]|nr:aldo/keto reductase [Bacillota bacterium]